VSKWVLFYEPADDVVAKSEPHFPAHLARLKTFHSRGELLMVGTFGDPQADGSMSIFSTREAAERFVEGDGFIHHGLVRGWRLLEWNDFPLEAEAAARRHSTPSHEGGSLGS
jgi:uncharacterized protein YciI